MGAVERNDVRVRNKKRLAKQRNAKQNAYRTSKQPPSLLSKPFPPFALQMRPRPPFPPGRMPPPGMGPMPPPGVRMPPPPPPLFRPRGPPPPRMGPHGPMPPMPMRPRPPLMGPPPLMRPPPIMGPRRYPPRLPPPPPQMIPPNKMRQLKNKIGGKKNNKKKVSGQNSFDLSSPWVTEGLKSEFDRKNQMLATARGSQKPADWDTFREQRSKCEKMFKAAKMEYIGKHPEEVFQSDESDEEYENENESTNSGYYCDACERSFAYENQFDRHMSEHKVCGIDGCKFVAHAKIVEKHIDMQHVTGLYYRISQSDSPEDIAKWIAERKKRYPSKENIEKRQKQQEEMMKRGERIQFPKNRFGKDFKKVPNEKTMARGKKPWQKRRNQSNFNGVPPKRRCKTSSTKPVSLLDDRSTWNGNLPPFQGTADLYEDNNETNIPDEIDDNEWIAEQSTSKKIQLNNALGALIGAYQSSGESDEEISVPKYIPPNIKTVETIEDSTNVEIEDGEIVDNENDNKNVVEPEGDKLIESSINNEKHKRKRRRNRRSCDKKNEKEIDKTDFKKNVPERRRFSKRRITLLEKLLAPDIRHERNVILQCVRYVVDNHFFLSSEDHMQNIENRDLVDENNCPGIIDKNDEIGKNNFFVDNNAQSDENRFLSNRNNVEKNKEIKEIKDKVEMDCISSQNEENCLKNNCDLITNTKVVNIEISRERN